MVDSLFHFFKKGWANNVLYAHPLVSLYFKKNKHSADRIGWGYKRSGLKAKNSGKPFLLFEDAFVRSLKPGYLGSVYGITNDRSGAVFDAENGCDLIDLIESKNTVRPETHQIIESFKELRVSKYNWTATHPEVCSKRGVLLVDQSLGDSSLVYGGVTCEDFDRMFDDAVRDNPHTTIYIKTHPDHKFKGAKSCFSERVFKHPQSEILPAELPSYQCFDWVDKVYIATSLLGFEALLYGKTVYAYGWNFFAGWGLTVDRCNFQLRRPRKKTSSLEQVFEAAYLDYSIYYHPDTSEECSLSEIIEHIYLQKVTWRAFSGSCAILASNEWKKYVFSLYIKGPVNSTELCDTLEHFEKTDAQRKFIWGSAKTDAKVTRVEDGFIRSNDLGATFAPPSSLVFDDIGIYYDSSKSSRLEKLLLKSDLDLSEKKRSEKLISKIIKHRITKYNAPRVDVSLPSESRGKKIILIPGQVEDDASIIYGSLTFKTNLDLIKEVRTQNPDAFIIFKPHPDVMKVMRKGRLSMSHYTTYCDLVRSKGDIISWINVADEIHTITSTVGFDALIRKKKVFCYGMPFYAGWGLTTDKYPCGRRIRSLTLPELVYSALIEYPIYINVDTQEFTTVENVIDLLVKPRKKKVSVIKFRAMRVLIKTVKNLLSNK